MKVLKQKRVEQRPGFRKIVLAEPRDLEREVFVQVVEITQDVARHYHQSTTEIFYVLSNQGVEFIISDNPLVPKEGELIVCEPGEVHQIRNPDKKLLKMLVFKLDYREGDTIWLSRQ